MTVTGGGWGVCLLEYKYDDNNGDGFYTGRGASSFM
jgi:hypothetical protein